MAKEAQNAADSTSLHSSRNPPSFSRTDLDSSDSPQLSTTHASPLQTHSSITSPIGSLSVSQNYQEESVAILIPCYNEAATIGKVVTDFRAVLPSATIYVYNNNSTDNTAQIAHDAGAIVKNVPLQGKGNVIRAMFRDIIADIYILVDGDDTYPAESAPALIEKIHEGYEMVCGDRLSTTYFSENKRAFHNFGNQLVRGLINWGFHSHFHDIMTGYRAMSFSFIKSFATLSAGFEIETEMAIFCLNNRIAFCEVPIQYRDRPEGSESKLNTVVDGIKVVNTIATMIRDCRPFAFFGIISAILLIIGIAIMIPVFISFGQTGLVMKLPTLIAGSFIVLTGVLSFMTALILEVNAERERRHFVLTANEIVLEKAVLTKQEVILDNLKNTKSTLLVTKH